MKVKKVTSDISNELGCALGGISVELGDRLKDALCEADAVAVRSALMKAAVIGVNHGVAHVVYSMRQVCPQFDLTGDIVHSAYDEWAERYGALR